MTYSLLSVGFLKLKKNELNSKWLKSSIEKIASRNFEFQENRVISVSNFQMIIFEIRPEMGSRKADGCPGSEADGVFSSDPLAAKIRWTDLKFFHIHEFFDFHNLRFCSG